MKKFISLIAMAVLTLTAFAQSTWHFSLGAEYASTPAYSNYFFEKQAYGFDAAYGYEFNRFATVSLGVGAYRYFEPKERNKKSDTSVPVFIRYRARFLDGKISPVVEADFGYVFGIGSSSHPATLYQYKDSPSGKFDDIVTYEQHLVSGTFDDLRADHITPTMRKVYQIQYANTDRTYDSFMMDGLYSRIALGATFKLGGVSLDVLAGVTFSQYFHGRILNFSGNNVSYYQPSDDDFAQAKTEYAPLGMTDYEFAALMKTNYGRYDGKIIRYGKAETMSVDENGSPNGWRYYRSEGIKDNHWYPAYFIKIAVRL